MNDGFEGTSAVLLNTVPAVPPLTPYVKETILKCARTYPLVSGEIYVVQCRHCDEQRMRKEGYSAYRPISLAKSSAQVMEGAWVFKLIEDSSGKWELNLIENTFTGQLILL